MDGLIVWKVYDILGVGTDEFQREEWAQSKNVKRKYRNVLVDTYQEFNGRTSISEVDGAIRLAQDFKVARLSPSTTQNAFDSRRALPKYIGVNVRPHILAPIELIARGTEATTDQ